MADSSGEENYILRSFFSANGDVYSDEALESTPALSPSSSSSSTAGFAAAAPPLPPPVLASSSSSPPDLFSPTTTSSVDGVTVLQNKSAGISSQLWPAASHLAGFVLHEIGHCRLTLASADGKEPIVTMHTDFEKDSDNPSIVRSRAALRSLLSSYLSRSSDSSSDSSSSLSSSSFPPPLRFVERGAGVGLTGRKVQKHLSSLLSPPLIRSTVLLTDVEEALPLLKLNILANFPKEEARGADHTETDTDTTMQQDYYSAERVTARRLCWGTDDYADVLSSLSSSSEPSSSDSNVVSYPPLFDVLLAADCVYWEALHAPLKSTLLSLLSNCPSAVCLIAGVRRWKRDNAFYKSINKVRSKEGRLVCECVSETVQRTSRDRSVGGLNAKAMGTEDCDHDQDVEREVMKIFSVRFVPTATTTTNAANRKER